MKPRRRARSLILEILYEYDVADHEPIPLLQRRLNEPADEYIDDEAGPNETLTGSTIAFTRNLLVGVLHSQMQIDELIQRYAPEWPLDQIAVIDRNILRIAIYEVLLDESTPIKVAINEAVELAKAYGSDSSPRFVNGVLGTLTESTEELRAELVPV